MRNKKNYTKTIIEGQHFVIQRSPGDIHIYIHSDGMDRKTVVVSMRSAVN